MREGDRRPLGLSELGWGEDTGSRAGDQRGALSGSGRVAVVFGEAKGDENGWSGQHGEKRHQGDGEVPGRGGTASSLQPVVGRRGHVLAPLLSAHSANCLALLGSWRGNRGWRWTEGVVDSLGPALRVLQCRCLARRLRRRYAARLTEPERSCLVRALREDPELAWELNVVLRHAAPAQRQAVAEHFAFALLRGERPRSAAWSAFLTSVEFPPRQGHKLVASETMQGRWK